MSSELYIKDLTCYSNYNSTIKFILKFVNAWYQYNAIFYNI